jgi:PEP-CTERM motif-containing protein
VRLRLCCLLLVCASLSVISAVADDVYNNGPINGTTDAWTINFGFFVSDTFTVSTPNTPITSLTFGAWLFPGDVLQSVEVSMTSDVLGGTTYFDQVVNVTQSGCSGNQFGFDVCTETGMFGGPTLEPGTYWLNLQNAVVNNGDPVYWDENSGIGCTSKGCPSVAETDCIQDYVGCIPSESFTLSSGGGVNGTTPEPSSAVLFGSGLLSVVAVLRRKIR